MYVRKGKNRKERQTVEHLKEQELTLYILRAPEMESRRTAIESHLSECAGCSALCNEIRAYYVEVDSLEKTTHDVDLAVVRPAETVSRRDKGQTSLRAGLIRRMPEAMLASFKAYPLRWSGAFALLFAAVLLWVPKMGRSDGVPAIARAKDEFVVVLNQNGNELWKKYVGPDFETLVRNTGAEPRIVDIDGKGAKEILVMNPTGLNLNDAWIESFDEKGIERWRFDFHPTMVFGKTTFAGSYYLPPSMDVGDFGGTGKCEILFVARQDVWWPAVVGLLNARNGEIAGTYWHPGWIAAAARDIDGDRIQELIVSGYNNAFKLNSLAILDPRYMSGHAPSTPDFSPNGVVPATEKYYVLLPAPDLFGLSLRLPAGTGSGFSIVRGSMIEIRTSRFILLNRKEEFVVEVFFEFDGSLRCINVRLGDEFVALHRRLEREGKVKEKVDDHYIEELRRSVQYWDGTRFVQKQTINKKYLEKISGGGTI